MVSPMLELLKMSSRSVNDFVLMELSAVMLCSTLSISMTSKLSSFSNSMVSEVIFSLADTKVIDNKKIINNNGIILILIFIHLPNLIMYINVG